LRGRWRGQDRLCPAFCGRADDPALEVPAVFTLVQTYETKIGLVFHYDLWRIDGPLRDGARLEDALDAIILVEWPDRLATCGGHGAGNWRSARDGGKEAALTGWSRRLPPRSVMARLSGHLFPHLPRKCPE